MSLVSLNPIHFTVIANILPKGRPLLADVSFLCSNNYSNYNNYPATTKNCYCLFEKKQILLGICNAQINLSYNYTQEKEKSGEVCTLETEPHGNYGSWMVGFSCCKKMQMQTVPVNSLHDRVKGSFILIVRVMACKHQRSALPWRSDAAQSSVCPACHQPSGFLSLPLIVDTSCQFP